VAATFAFALVDRLAFIRLVLVAGGKRRTGKEQN
jgi:hypothetical protein